MRRATLLIFSNESRECPICPGNQSPTVLMYSASNLRRQLGKHFRTRDRG